MSSATDRLKKAVDELNECPCEYHAKEAERAWEGLDTANTVTVVTEAANVFIDALRAWWKGIEPMVTALGKVLEGVQAEKKEPRLRKEWGK